MSDLDVPRPISELRADLGEGPIWDPAENAFRFVDITNRVTYRYDPSSNNVFSSLEVPQEIGAVIPRRRGGLIAAVRDGIATIDEHTGDFQLIAPIEADRPANRMNDAKCDSQGRLWAGTMAFDSAPRAGALYRIEGSGGVTRVLDGVTISNGIGWSTDDCTMYYVDSTEGIDTFRFDSQSGEISDRRRLVTIEPEVGLPDGMTVDAEGFLWVAIWGAGSVHRYTPSGQLDHELRLPVSQVTSIAFGGPDYEEMFITTARIGLTPDDLRNEPLAGACFSCRPGVRGRPSFLFAG